MKAQQVVRGDFAPVLIALGILLIVATVSYLGFARWGLEPVRRGDTVSYEPVNQFVGHIPGTANPGEIGTGWYFGHLESPGLGEGNVFHRVPELTELIKQEAVDLYLYTETAVFNYRVVETKVMRAEDLALSDSRDARVALVASFPSRVYTHRLIVFAELFARRALTTD